MLRSLAPALAAGLVLLLIVGGALWGILSVADDVDLPGLLRDRYVLGVLRFTVGQAFLSALISVALAVPVARALARRQAFRGRTLLLRLLGLPMVVPTIVGVLGLLAVYGRSGLVNRVFEGVGLDIRLDVYGLPGILLAHVFFNMPFATRLLVQGWATIPGESWRLAAQLGMTSGPIFRLIEWPMLRTIVPGIFGLAFLLCFTSFAIVLALGGGPPNATLEVAIYQALRFDFDIGRVVAFALLQVAVCGLLVCAGHRLARPIPAERTIGRLEPRHDGDSALSRLADGAVLLLALIMLIPPLAAVAAAAAGGPLAATLGDAGLWRAAIRSIVVSLAAGLIACLLGWGLLTTARELRLRFYRRGAANALELAGALVLVLPPFVIGAGLFVLLQPVADVFAIGLGLVVLVNALIGLPFVLRILGPAMTQVHERHLRLSDSLGLAGWHRFRLVDWPLLRRQAALAMAVATALAMGDLGVIALFGTAETGTLPYLLYQQMGSYRLDEAAVTAAVLVALCLALFLLLERAVGGAVMVAAHDRAP